MTILPEVPGRILPHEFTITAFFKTTNSVSKPDIYSQYTLLIQTSYGILM